MTDKQRKILDILMSRSGEFISGQELAEIFTCSRAAIWKNIMQIREKGYLIEAVTHLGYRLIQMDSDIEMDIHQSLVQAGLFEQFDVYVLEEVDSTNSIVRSKGISGHKEGFICLARIQNQGRGRQGNTWVSDSIDGLWFSMLLRPQILPEDAGLLSLFFAWNVFRAIRDCGLIDIAVKWPNDLVSLRSGKKICGILSEGIFEDNNLSFAVVGCGINVSHRKFPRSIENIATSLLMEGLDVSLSKLFVSILKCFNESYHTFNKDVTAFLPDYKKDCVTLGREVRILQENHIIGKAVDISDKGALIVDLGEGKNQTFFAGEVSVRGLMGYV